MADEASRDGEPGPTLSGMARFLRFASVGALGFVVNLAAFGALVHGAGVPYLVAATLSFLVAVTHNYLLNRAWTFRDARRGFVGQGARFAAVSVVALGVNLAILDLLVAAGSPKLLGQAIAVVLAIPVNFLGNRLWSFRRLTQAATSETATFPRPVTKPGASRRGERPRPRARPAVCHLVDDEPSPTRECLPEPASIVGGKPPQPFPRLLARLFAGAAPAVIAAESRGASNAKAKR